MKKIILFTLFLCSLVFAQSSKKVGDDLYISPVISHNSINVKNTLSKSFANIYYITLKGSTKPDILSNLFGGEDRDLVILGVSLPGNSIQLVNMGNLEVGKSGLLLTGPKERVAFIYDAKQGKWKRLFLNK